MRMLPATICAMLLLLAMAGQAVAVPTPVARALPGPSSDGSSAAGPTVVAHRGGAAYGPENTMLAVENAARLGVDAIEIDVMLSADDELVIIHDDMLERTTDCTGAVAEHTVVELQRCDAAHWWSPGQAPTRPDTDAEHPLRGSGVTVPTLRELLVWAAAQRETPRLAIEVKSIPGERNFDAVSRAAAEEVVSLVHEFDLTDDVIVYSFWPPVIDNVQLLDPQLPTLLLTTSELGVLASAGLTYAAARDHDAVGPNHDAPDLDERFMQLADALGREVHTYTVDTVAEQQRVIDLGVDAVISDWPACTLQLLDRPVRGQVLPAAALAGGARPMGPCPGA